jgi:hypothetical protein
MTVVALLLLGPLLTAAFFSAQPTLAASRNFILINTDDLDADSLRSMPNGSRLLVQGGASFTQFIVAAPDCCPSRASLLRGQYVHDHGILRGSNKLGEGKFRSRGLEDSTIFRPLPRAAASRIATLSMPEGDDLAVLPGWRR